MDSFPYGVIEEMIFRYELTPFDSLRRLERDDVMIAMDAEQGLYVRFSDPENLKSSSSRS